jgi:hypothetical protein
MQTLFQLEEVAQVHRRPKRHLADLMDVLEVGAGHLRSDCGGSTTCIEPASMEKKQQK